MKQKIVHYAEDYDSTPDHADDLDAVLLEAGLEYLTEISMSDSEYE